MPQPKHLVILSNSERDALTAITKKYRYSQRERNRAHILLLTEQGHCDEAIARQVGCCDMTVRNVRVRYQTTNDGEALPIRQRVKRAEQKNRTPRTFDADKEAHLVALACSTPPEGAARWTLSLLRDRLIEMNILDSVGRETIRRTLKKMNTRNCGAVYASSRG